MTEEKVIMTATERFVVAAYMGEEHPLSNTQWSKALLSAQGKGFLAISHSGATVTPLGHDMLRDFDRAISTMSITAFQIDVLKYYSRRPVRFADPHSAEWNSAVKDLVDAWLLCPVSDGYKLTRIGINRLNAKNVVRVLTRKKP